ncbi:MAG: hypothetical protein Q7U85_01945 [Rhodocyclaceae bacterium]|nr:hypothetical protein [Rhodocyclaceae bacterium]
MQNNARRAQRLDQSQSAPIHRKALARTQKHVARLARAGQPDPPSDAFDPRRPIDPQGTIVLQRNCLGYGRPIGLNARFAGISLRRNFAAVRFHGHLLFDVLPV